MRASRHVYFGDWAHTHTPANGRKELQMQRRTLIDGQHWFDLDTSERFGDYTLWDGPNWISLATGNDSEHQDLFRTRGGHWIRSSRSNREGSQPTYEEIDATTAAAWLIRNRHEPHAACAKEAEQLQIK
jgi:hypothetical protein